MKTNLKNVVLLTVALSLLSSTALLAQNSRRGGNGGGDKGPSYSIHHLDDYGGLVTDVYPSDLNDDGQIVGWVNDPVDGLKAAFWSTNVDTGSSTLKLLADGIVANSINSNGEIVGAQRESDGNSIGRYWRDQDDVSPLPLFPRDGDEHSNALAINRDGVIVGWSDHYIMGFDPRPGADPNVIITLKVERHPVVWRIVQDSVQGPFELPNLLDIDPTANPDNGYGNAVSLNDNNQAGLATVVGHFYLSEEITANGGGSNGVTHAARWTIAFNANGQLLATAAVIANGAGANHVNNQDVTCGEIIDSSPSPVAAVWSPDEKILHRLRDVNENSAWHINISLDSYGAGLPSFEDNRNPFGYKFSWNPKGLMKSALASGEYIRNGKVVEAKNLFDHFRIVDLEGLGTFETYPNRTCAVYKEPYELDDDVSFYRGLLRFTGWCNTIRKFMKLNLLDYQQVSDFKNLTYNDFMSRLVNSSKGGAEAISKYLDLELKDDFINKLRWLGFFEDQQIAIKKGSNVDVLVDLMLKKMSYQPHEKDMAIVHDDIVVDFNGAREKWSSTMVLNGIPEGDSAMARAVSLPVAISTRLILEGKITLRGSVLPVYPEIYNPVLEELEEFDIKYVHKKRRL